MSFLDAALIIGSFSLAYTVAAMTPGPALIVVTQTSISASRRAGIFNALGFGVGALIWAICALFGLNLLFTEVPWIYQTVKILGGLYLLYLGYRLWRSKGIDGIEIRADALQTTSLAAFGKGLIIQLTNPEIIIFMGAVLSSLLPTDPPPAMLTVVLVIIFSVEFIWYSIVAIVCSHDRLRTGYARASRIIDRIAGTLLALIALRLFFWN